MLIEPRGHALNHIALVRGIGKHVAFMLVNNQLSFYTQSFERVPEFVRLRRRTLSITVPHKNKRGCFCVLDKRDGRALGIHLWVVIDRSAKERDHPLVNLVLTVIALE